MKKINKKQPQSWLRHIISLLPEEAKKNTGCINAASELSSAYYLNGSKSLNDLIESWYTLYEREGLSSHENWVFSCLLQLQETVNRHWKECRQVPLPHKRGGRSRRESR